MKPQARSDRRIVAGLVVAVIVLAGVSHAQLTSAALVGTVRDQGGSLVVGAKVSVRNLATNQTRSDVTTADGLYRISDLAAASYELRFEKAGFKTTVTSNVTLHVGETSRVDATLSVGMIKETIEVADKPVLVNTEDAGTNNIVEEKQVEELPLVRRNIYQLPVLEPGTSPTRVLMPTYYNNSVYDMGFVSYGKNIRSANFMLDGAPNNDNGLGGIPAVAPILDAVQEFQVSTNDFAREYGRNFGADINVATKAGTNQIHGSLWEFHRNAAVNARNFFDAQNPSALIHNQFGFTLGGAIRKDQTFWFVAYEGFREKRGTTRDVQVETPELRSFVATNFPDTVANFLFQHFPGPSTILANTGVNVGIQPDDIPDVGIGVGQAVNHTATDQYLVRLDHDFGVNDRIFVRWVGDYPRSSGAGELTTIGGLGRIMRGFRRPSSGFIGNLAVGYTHLFGQSFLNDFRFGYLRNRAFTNAFPGNVPNFFMNDLTLGFGSDFFIPINFTNNAFNFKDNVSINHGRHGLKMGVEYNHDLEASTFDTASRGVYVFGNLSGFVADSPAAYEVHIDPLAGESIINSPNRHRHFRRRDFAWYFQDDWKLGKNLTVNAGVRWEYFGVIHETSGKQAGMILGSGSTLQEQLIGATLGRVSELYQPNYHNFGPLLGMAWDPTGKGKFSVRGAWAINYDRIHSDLLSEPARFTPPFGAFALAVPGITNCNIPAYDVADVFQFPPSLPAGFGGGLNSNGMMDPTLPGGCASAEVMAIDRKLSTPYVEQWNLTVQYELANDWLLELSYAGNQGHRLSFTNDPNRVTGGATPAVPCSPNDVPLGARPNCVLAEPLLATVDYLSTTGYSNYNGGSVQLKKQFSHGYLLQASYTYGKVLDLQDDANAGDFIGSGTGYNGTVDASKTRLDYGRSSFDIRHRLAANGVWEIGSLAKHGPVVRAALGDWQINTIFSYESGRPFTVFNSVQDYNGDGGGAAQAPPTGNAYDRPDTTALGNSVGCKSPHAYAFPTVLFKPSDFSPPAPNTNGNLGRNTFCGPNFKGLDFSLVRNFKAPFMGEHGRIQFRAEAFNALNRVNLYLPDGDLGLAGLRPTATTFGSSTQAYSPRELQFGLKISW
jgi:Carboxypeptidase regulatory-like domain